MKLKALAATLAVVATPAMADTNLVVNGGFETGDFTGWSSNWFVTTGIANVFPYEGNYFASTGCFDYCTLTQTIATTPGESYTFSFAFNPGLDADGGGADTQVYWNGSLVIDIIGGELGWTLYSFAETATSASTQIEFSGIQPATYNGVDAVSVTSGAVPEASTWAMMLAGFAGLGIAACRARKIAKAV